jgi:predicted ATPase/DNA-binding SARP family transcriptional activator
VELTSFVGRSDALAELATLMRTSRLVTLTGAGGSGKTRLALELARGGGGPDPDREEGWTPSPWSELAWVELARVEDEAQVPAAVAGVLGAREGLARPDAASLGAFLGDRSLLLVLDNCEHVVDACAALVDGLLRAAPGLRVLATSRAALGVPGERAWLVPALSLPASDDLPALEGSEAARLFVARARDVAPDFALTPANAAAVAEICRRLDGIPLALELAASRVRLLQPAQILARLHDAFHLLESPSRTAIPRHRTLRATIDWSHDLLGEEERILFRRLAAFRGGFTLDAAEAVIPGDGIDPAGVLGLVTGLVDRSLVSVREQEGAARCTLLETVRQYAAERLAESGEAGSVQGRHARYFAALAIEADPHFRGPERPLWVQRILPDIDNLREALAWTRTHDPALHVRMVGALHWFWFSTRHWGEHNRWTAEALALPVASAPGRDRAALLFAAGSMASLQARPGEAIPLLWESIELAGEAGDDRLEAYALNYLGMAHAQSGSQEGQAASERARGWFEEHGDLYGLRLACLILGTMAMGRGDRDEALRLNREGVAVARRFGQPRELGVSLQNTALTHIARGELEAAEALTRESLEALREDPSHFFISISLDYLGEILGRRGRLEEAARLLGAGDAIRRMVAANRFPMNEARLAALLPGFREAAGAEAWDRHWREGGELGLERVLDTLPPALPPSPTGAPASPAHATARPSAQRPTPPSPSVHDLTVRALGPFAVEVEGRAIPPADWSYTKPRELLVLLLMHPEGATRHRLGEGIWPGASASQVKNSFHVTLHHLRRALGHPEWVILEGDRYRVAPSVRAWIDAGAFEAGARDAGSDPGRLREVLDLWKGDLLEDDPAGPWITELRDHLRRIRVEALMALAGALEAAGDDAGAAEMYRQVVLVEELHEKGHRGLMATWARTGHRVRALRHYEELVLLLRRELDTAPERETAALAEALREG